MRHRERRHVKGCLGDITGGLEGPHTYTIFISHVRKSECREATHGAMSGPDVYDGSLLTGREIFLNSGIKHMRRLILPHGSMKGSRAHPWVRSSRNMSAVVERIEARAGTTAHSEPLIQATGATRTANAPRKLHIRATWSSLPRDVDDLLTGQPRLTIATAAVMRFSRMIVKKRRTP